MLMRDPTVKQAARAMLDCGVQLDLEGRRNVVRAVLLAMRNPSENMLSAAYQVANDDNRSAEIWQAMIDAGPRRWRKYSGG